MYCYWMHFSVCPKNDMKIQPQSSLFTGLGLKKSLCERERLFLSQQAELELGDGRWLWLLRYELGGIAVGN